MLFSAYQIESLLEDIQHDILPVDNSVSETLNVSEDAIQEARQYLRTPKKRSLAWILPSEIKALVEDQTSYDPVVDHVQQSRAGRFVIPMYVPDNPAPSFPLVSDRTKVFRERDTFQDENTEMALPGKESPLTGENIKNYSAEDLEHVLDAEDLVQDSNPEIELSELRRVFANDRADDLAQESTDVERLLETKESYNSTSTKSIVSAVSLLDEVVLEDEQYGEVEFDSDGLQGNIDDDSDVVFGSGRIEKKSMIKFVSNYPDSTIKFLLRKNIDGRPLPAGYEEIYGNWENRGLSRGRLKKYLFKLMEWQDFPELSVLEVVRKIRERHFDLKEKNK